MSIITKIRSQIGMLVLKRESKRISRDKQICNLNNASHVGILYYLPDEAAYRIVSAYVKQLQESGKKVKALGYVESKLLTGQFLPKLSYDFLYPSGLSWNYKPVATTAKDFIETEFDILIDLTTDNILPLLFITALSRAKFKAGMQSAERAGFLDLMISLKEKQEMEELIKQIDHYLSIINKEK